MITARAWAGRHYAVYGLARSGLATVQALLASGARVTAWDEREEARAALEEELRSSRAQSRGADESAVERPSSALGTSGLEIADLNVPDLTPFDSLVLSPGVPLNTHPLAARAREAGVEIIGDIELFARARPELPPHKVVGITGTNGKSTTTALIQHILATAGVPAAMGGNIGLPILAQDPLPEGGVYVLELSSFQIDLTQGLDCEVAVLTNLSPDHLDRYADEWAYYEAKQRLFEMQSDGQLGIWMHDDENSWQLFDALDPPAERWIYLGQRCSLDRDVGEFGSSLGDSLAGPHNLANAAEAIEVCRQLGVPDEVIRSALQTFHGLPHRMERVREYEGVLFINDSKATNPEAAAPALAAYPRVRWVVGGQAKTDTLGDTAKHLDHVVHAYTIGEAGPLFARLLRERGTAVTEAETLQNAVKRAAADSQAGEVVLLSPACASFDQFRDFEARGEAFRRAVGELP